MSATAVRPTCSFPQWCVTDHAGEGEDVPSEHGEWYLRHRSTPSTCHALDTSTATPREVEVVVDTAAVTTNEPAEDQSRMVRLEVPTDSWRQAYFTREQAERLAHLLLEQAAQFPQDDGPGCSGVSTPTDGVATTDPCRGCAY